MTVQISVNVDRVLIVFPTIQAFVVADSMLNEQAEFYDLVKHYAFFSKKGWFDLEAFCVSLSLCLVCDGHKQIAPEPVDVYRSFLNIASQRLDEEQFNQYIKNPNDNPVMSSDVGDYLDHSVTSVHIGAMLECMHDWMVDIGKHLLDPSPFDEHDALYFGWVDENWTFTHTLVSGLHNALINYMKSVDANTLAKTKPVRTSKHNGHGFESSSQTLEQIIDAQKSIKARIVKAIEDGFSLEALSLQECLIKNCLFQFLIKQGVPANGLTLYQMLKHAKRVQRNHAALLDDISTWLIDREKAASRYIEGDTLSDSENEFDIDATDAAIQGVKLCQNVCDWYVEDVLCTAGFGTHNQDNSGNTQH